MPMSKALRLENINAKQTILKETCKDRNILSRICLGHKTVNNYPYLGRTHITMGKTIPSLTEF